MIRQFFGSIRKAFIGGYAAISAKAERTGHIDTPVSGGLRHPSAHQVRNSTRGARGSLGESPAPAPVRVRKANCTTGNPSGNAHDRRKSRRSHKAHEWYMRTLQMRAGKLAAA